MLQGNGYLADETQTFAAHFNVLRTNSLTSKIPKSANHEYNDSKSWSQRPETAPVKSFSRYSKKPVSVREGESDKTPQVEKD